MKKTVFNLIALFFFIQFIIPAYIFAEEPVIKESEVKRVDLFLAERAGAIDGYVIFYDKDERQCAVEVTSEFGPPPAILYCGDKYAHIFERKLYITPRDFKFFDTRNNNICYGYIIEPFTMGISKKKITIFFEWGTLSASTTMYTK